MRTAAPSSSTRSRRCAGNPGEDAARAGSTRDHPLGPTSPSRRHPRRRRSQGRPRRSGRARRFPRRSLLPAERRDALDPALARTARTTSPSSSSIPGPALGTLRPRRARDPRLPCAPTWPRIPGRAMCASFRTSPNGSRCGWRATWELRPQRPASSGATLPERLERYEADIPSRPSRRTGRRRQGDPAGLGIPRKTFYDSLAATWDQPGGFYRPAGAKSATRRWIVCPHSDPPRSTGGS